MGQYHSKNSSPLQATSHLLAISGCGASVPAEAEKIRPMMPSRWRLSRDSRSSINDEPFWRPSRNRCRQV